MQSALPLASRLAQRAATGRGPRPVWQVTSIGHRIEPKGDFEARVHSVFARACNLQSGGELLTLCLGPSPEGPTTLCVDAPVGDLRIAFADADILVRRGDWLDAPRVMLWMARARTWRPLAWRAPLESHLIVPRVGLARERLARQSNASVLVGAAVVDALVRAARERDLDATLVAIDRLVGWGEGLTPAGDDFLVGWLAGLHQLASERDDYREAVARAVVGRAGRTTIIAAHMLRLAADGDFAAPVDRIRDALFCAPRDDDWPGAVETLLALGATSGADTLRGLLAAATARGAA